MSLTFYGVPLKLAPRTNKPEEQKELADLERQSGDIEKQITASVTQLEAVITRQDPSYRPESAVELVQMLRRAEAALGRSQKLMSETSDILVRRQLESAMLESIRQMGGPAAIVQHARPTMLRSLPPTTSPTAGTLPAMQDPQAMWDLLKTQVTSATREVQQLASQRDNIESRKRLREVTARSSASSSSCAWCRRRSTISPPTP